MQEVAPPTGTVKPLTKKQIKAVILRADGNSWDQIAKQLDITERTLRKWRKHPDWDVTLAERKETWIEEYEMKFTRMMPKVAHTHIKLLHSSNEAIQMRAVDSAHTNHGRLVRERETQDEVAELKAMVLTLTEQLAQEKAKG